MKLRATERGIHRAMNAGRLSYEKTESGEHLIDVSELQRLFGEVRPEDVKNDALGDRGHATQLAETRAQLELERAKNGLWPKYRGIERPRGGTTRGS